MTLALAERRRAGGRSSRDRPPARGPRREAGRAGTGSELPGSPLAKGRWRGPFVLALLGVAAFLCLLIGIRRFPDVFDEGYALYGAERILNGEVPYRDFWLVYAPAQFYVLAVIFKLLGFSIMTARIYDVLVRFAIVVLMYSISAKLSSSRAALVSALLGTLWLGSIDFYGYAMYPATALTLLGLWILLRHLQAPWAGWPPLCGLAFGATTLFRHDFGLYGTVTAAGVLTASSWFGAGKPGAAPAPPGGAAQEAPSGHRRHASTAPREETSPLRSSRSSERLRAVWWSLWPFAAGVALPVVAVLLALLTAVPAKDIWFDLVLFPAKILNKYRQLPYPALPGPGMATEERRLSILLYFSIALFAGSVVSLLIQRLKRRAMALRGWGTVALTLLGILYLRQGLNRADAIHLLPTTLIVAVLAPVLLSAAVQSRRRGVSILLIAVVIVAAGDAYVVGPLQELLPLLRPIPTAQRYSVPRGRGIERVRGEDEAIRYVRDHTAAGEPIFVGASHHDQVVVNDILFYFLAERPCASRYHDLTPGVVTTLPVQQEIVAELERKNVRTVVLCFYWHNIQEPNEGGRSSGVRLLDDYLLSHFQRVAEFGGYLIIKRKEG
jgi:hypothetical protein